MTTEATVVANTSETESMIEDLAGYLASGNEAVNDEYAGRVFKDLTATHIKRLHGSKSLEGKPSLSMSVSVTLSGISSAIWPQEGMEKN